MADLWPWMAIAGLGTLHGLHPATGWMFAAAWGVSAGDEAQVRHALLPIAGGHAASIAVVAFAVAQAPVAAAASAEILFRNVRVFDGKAAQLTASSSVLIKGNIIN